MELTMGSLVGTESPAALSCVYPDDPAQHDFGNDDSCLLNTLLFSVSPASILAQAET